MAKVSIKEKIEENFRKFPWHGGVPIEEVIAAAIQYRKELGDKDRALYDERIALGIHPLAAIETVEIASGRMKPQGSQPVQEPVAAK